VKKQPVRLTVLLLGAIVALGFALRVGVFLDAPRPFEGAGLAAEQGEIARNIVDHGRWFVVNPQAYGLVKDRQVKQHALVDPASVNFSVADRKAAAVPEVDQMPGVAFVLAGLWWLTGNETYALIQWLQILLDSLMIVLVYWLGIRLTRSARVALLAALLYAIWPGAIVVATRPVLDTWAAFFTIGCVAAFVWARDRPTSRWRLALLGLVAGIGIYFRPFVVLIPIALALAATPGGGWRRRLLWLAAPTAISILLLAPWTIRNYSTFHRFIPTRTGLGQAVFEGTGQSSSDEGTASYVRSHRAAAYGSPAYDDFLLAGAARAIADHPRFYLGLILHRARLLLPCLLALIVWRRWRTAAAIAVAAAAATIVPYLLIGDDTRFYLPAAFAYILLCAMVAEIGVSQASRHWGRLRLTSARQNT
jgi:4-amino-4-deoxy-L-arabinose transferase-like glycosyltransferase